MLLNRLQHRFARVRAQSTQTVQATINRLTGCEAFQQKDVQGLRGRTAIVTGGTRGIGFEVAKTLAYGGARVVMISRKQESGRKALGSIRDNADHAGALDLRFVECDFGNLRSVKSVADQLADEEPRLDILVNNAGIGVAPYGLDGNGIERIFGVNVLGHFLFTNRLLPLLRTTSHRGGPTPRIVSVTSNLHQLAPSTTSFTSLKELNDPDLRVDQYYARSKLAVILYVKALVRRALAPNGDKILAMSVHPGAVSTEIQNQVHEAFGQVLGRVITALQTPMLRAPDEGSLGVLWAATNTGEELERRGMQGAYITDPGKAGGETGQADDLQLEENVWRLCEQLISERLGDDALYEWSRDST